MNRAAQRHEPSR